MAAVTLSVDDLAPFADIAEAKANAMINDALAMAAKVAPCILDEDFAYADAAKALIRGAILRWNEAGTGALTQQGAGPFQVSYDNRQTRRTLFWPSEITYLQDLCSEGGESGAFTVDTLGAGTIHAFYCDVYFGGADCSCGAALAGYPIYG